MPRLQPHALRAGTLPPWGPAIGCVLALSAGGCVGSPLPEPPTLSPAAIDVEPVDCLTCDRVVFHLRGLPGAATPDADLVLTDLDRAEPPLVIRVASDGSFSVSVNVLPGDEVRVQPRLAGRYGAPIEIVATVGADTLQLADRPLAGCFVVSPVDAQLLPPGGSTTVLVENRCAGSIRVSRASPRSDSLGVAVEGTVPFELGTGVSRALRIDVPTSAGAGEELVLLETDAPVRDRRSVLIVVAP